MLEASNATFAVGGKRLIEAIDLALPPGRLVCLIGPNGAGKSTLLRLFAGEIAPTAGSMRLDGRDLNGILPKELARRRAVLSQAPALSFPFTVLEVVLLGATVPGLAARGSRAAAAAQEAIRTVGLAGLEARLFTQLSGGERRRVHIARVLCQLAVARRLDGEASALLLDEPTANLDLAHQGIVLDEARRQARAGRAVLAVLHDLNLAAAYGDEIVLMSRGRIAGRGRAAEVLRDDLLSEVYGCRVRTNTVPAGGMPFILPGLPGANREA